MSSVSEIVFSGAFGEEMKIVTLSNVSGAGSAYQVLIDRFYNGSIVKRNAKWEWLNQPPDFTSEDTQLLGQWIDRQLAAYRR